MVSISVMTELDKYNANHSACSQALGMDVHRLASTGPDGSSESHIRDLVYAKVRSSLKTLTNGGANTKRDR